MGLDNRVQMRRGQKYNRVHKYKITFMWLSPSSFGFKNFEKILKTVCSLKDCHLVSIYTNETESCLNKL